MASFAVLVLLSLVAAASNVDAGCPHLANLAGLAQRNGNGEGRKLIHEVDNYNIDPPIYDPAGNGISVENLGSVGPYSYFLADVIEQIAISTGRDMCLFGTQILPYPPKGFDATAFVRGEDPCPPNTCKSTPEDIDQTDALAVENLGILALQRWAKLAKEKKLVVFGEWNMGSASTKLFCQLNKYTGKLCSKEITESRELYWPTAITVVKIPATNGSAQMVKDLFITWRASPEGHYPNRQSELVADRGFGYGGLTHPFNNKLIPCDMFPKELMYTAGVNRFKNGKLLGLEMVKMWGPMCNMLPPPGQPFDPLACGPPPHHTHKAAKKSRK